jgi:hypothetical protein
MSYGEVCAECIHFIRYSIPISVIDSNSIIIDHIDAIIISDAESLIQQRLLLFH